MDGEARLLLWNYTRDEKAELDRFLEELKAPPAVTIEKNQGYVLLKDIIHGAKRSEKEYECDEKIVLFYNVPPKGISFLINTGKERRLPSPIYASVTAHSIEWPFCKLAQELLHEREAVRVAMVMKDAEALIFDMDGVIADSEPLHFEAEKATLLARGIEAPWSEWHIFTGLTEEKIFRYIVDHFTDGAFSPEELIEAKFEIFIDMLNEKVQPVPGALDFISRSRKTFHKMAVTTSSLALTQQVVFNKFQLHDVFDVIVTGDAIVRGKPDPEPYVITVERLGLPAERCVVFEDSLNGIRSAKGAGCNVIGIGTSFSGKALLEAGAAAVIENFEFFDNNA